MTFPSFIYLRPKFVGTGPMSAWFEEPSGKINVEYVNVDVLSGILGMMLKEYKKAGNRAGETAVNRLANELIIERPCKSET